MARVFEGGAGEYPADEPVYLIQDGLSSHRMEGIRWWARPTDVALVPSATHASWMNPVETHARGMVELALPVTHFPTVAEVGETLFSAVAYQDEERIRRGKRYRDTARKNLRHRARIPVWLRTAKAEVTSQPVLWIHR